MYRWINWKFLRKKVYQNQSWFRFCSRILLLCGPLLCNAWKGLANKVRVYLKLIDLDIKLVLSMTALNQRIRRPFSGCWTQTDGWHSIGNGSTSHCGTRNLIENVKFLSDFISYINIYSDQIQDQYFSELRPPFSWKLDIKSLLFWSHYLRCTISIWTCVFLHYIHEKLSWPAQTHIGFSSVSLNHMATKPFASSLEILILI